tara:strand:- start:94 stop:282 length:189 start_codon:yes stop_codon:yes gene_type:complete
MNKCLQILKQSELYFIFALVLLNLYCAVAFRGDHFVDATHLMMAVIMLVFANDKIIEKLEKK